MAMGIYSASTVNPAGLSPFVYSQVVFVDRANGSDSNGGTSWADAMATVNGAILKIYGGVNSLARGRHYLIVYQGRTTSGLKHTSLQTISIEGVDLIGAGLLYGHGGGPDSTFVCGDPTGYAVPGHLQITASGVRVAGIQFYQSSDVAPATEQNYIYLTDPIGAAIHDNTFIGVNNNGDITNMKMNGVRALGFEGLALFRNHFYYCYRGFQPEAGAVRYATKALIENNRFQACDIGIYSPDQYFTESEIELNIIQDKQNYGFPMTAGIKMVSASGNLFADNRIGVNAAGDQHAKAYTKGSGTNYWAGHNFWSSTDTFNQLYAGT